MGQAGCWSPQGILPGDLVKVQPNHIDRDHQAGWGRASESGSATHWLRGPGQMAQPLCSRGTSSVNKGPQPYRSHRQPQRTDTSNAWCVARSGPLADTSRDPGPGRWGGFPLISPAACLYGHCSLRKGRDRRPVPPSPSPQEQGLRLAPVKTWPPPASVTSADGS